MADSTGYDERLAMSEIRGLSRNARLYLQDRLRNPMQVVRGGLDMNDHEVAYDGIAALDYELRKVGL